MVNHFSFLRNTFNGKKVLITGHTGFKGSWLCLYLKLLNANIIGISKDIPTKPSNFEQSNIQNIIKHYYEDVTDFSSINKIIRKHKPDFIFHLAAQSLVTNSYKIPFQTWNTNLLGTINILESIKSLNSKCCSIFITSDKCYLNKEWMWGYREIDQLGGIDPYSASKAAAEIAINSYYQSFFTKNKNIKIASARAGNVIGGGDWSANRIVPDAIKSWSNNKKLILRNPISTRPWQHVLEPLTGYLTLGNYIYKNNSSGESFNFGPSINQDHSVKDLISKMSVYWEGSRWSHPKIIKSNYYESSLLKLNCEKAFKYLKWKSKLNFEQTIKFTSDWYKESYKKNSNMQSFSKKQIIDYLSL